MDLLNLIKKGVDLVVKGTEDKTKWGVNIHKTDCPKCGQPLPRIRKPTDLQEFLWGGSTCKNCGAKVDKWGRERT